MLQIIGEIVMPYIEDFIGEMNNLLQQIYGFNAMVEMKVGQLCKSNVAGFLDNQMGTAEALSEKMKEFEQKYKAGDFSEIAKYFYPL